MESLGEIICDYVVARTDKSYSVAKLSRFSDNPDNFHYLAIKRVVRYLSQETCKGIICRKKKKADELTMG